MRRILSVKQTINPCLQYKNPPSTLYCILPIFFNTALNEDDFGYQLLLFDNISKYIMHNYCAII